MHTESLKGINLFEDVIIDGRKILILIWREYGGGGFMNWTKLSLFKPL
jgi:hypothetical protein